MFAHRNGIPWLMLTTLLVAWPWYAAAADWEIDTKINFVEGTSMPTGIYFWVAKKPPVSAGCKTDGLGTVLAYRARALEGADDKKENIKAVYATLLTATAADLTVRIGGLNANRTPNDPCNVEVIYLKGRDFSP